MPADNDPQKRLTDRTGGAQAGDLTKVVTPGNEKAAEVPASSGNDNNPISRVVEPAGAGFDPPAKAGDASAPADRPATDMAAGSDDNGQMSPKKASAPVVGPDMPVAGTIAASDEDAGKLPPPDPSPAIPPSATPDAGGGAADARSDAPVRGDADGRRHKRHGLADPDHARSARH